MLYMSFDITVNAVALRRRTPHTRGVAFECL